MPFYSELFLDIMELMRKQFLGASHNLSIFSKFFFSSFVYKPSPLLLGSLVVVEAKQASPMGEDLQNCIRCLLLP